MLTTNDQKLATDGTGGFSSKTEILMRSVVISNAVPRAVSDTVRMYGVCGRHFPAVH